jgi:CheY-like chemotaxis protein
MARGIGKLPGVEVVDAGTFAEALRFIDEKPPKLILSDLDLPDRSGLELLGALGARGLRIPIIFITAYLKAYGAQIPPHANVEVREKPIALEELRKLVKVYLEDTGSSPFSVSDYLQIASMGAHSVEITLERDDGRAGRIIVFGGTLWSAFDEQGSGPGAFKRMALLQNAFITCAAVRREPGERNVYDSLEHLLLEAAQLQDEATRDLANSYRASLSNSPMEAETSFATDSVPFSDASSLFAGLDLLDPEPKPAKATPEPPPPVAETKPAPEKSPLVFKARSLPEKSPLVFKAKPLPEKSPPARKVKPAPKPPPVEAAPPPPPPPPPPKKVDFDALWKQASEALLDKKYDQALELFRTADTIRPNDPKVLKYIERLTKKKA